MLPQFNERRLSSLKKASRFKVFLPGARGVYGSRETGASLFDRFWSSVTAMPFDCSVPLDFSEVRFIDVSAADEFLCKILQRLRSGELAGRYVFISSARPEVIATLELTLQARKLACLLEESGSFRIVGDLSQPLQETLVQVCKRGFATANELANGMKHSKSKLNIICNRLNTLSRWGLVHREREGAPKPGRQYSYHSIV